VLNSRINRSIDIVVLLYITLYIYVKGLTRYEEHIVPPYSTLSLQIPSLDTYTLLPRSPFSVPLPSLQSRSSSMSTRSHIQLLPTITEWCKNVFLLQSPLNRR